MTLPQALLSLTCSPVHATPSLFRKVIRILYNLAVDDTNELLLLILKDPLTSQFLDKGFQNGAFTSCKYELTQNGQDESKKDPGCSSSFRRLMIDFFRITIRALSFPQNQHLIG